MAEQRTYEVMVIIDSKATSEETGKLIELLTGIIEKQGATIVKSEDMGIRKLAYEIDHRTEGHYWLYEIDGSGSEIAELERRMRVNDLVVRYLTVRVDLDRRRAAKFASKRTRRKTNRANRRSGNNSNAEFAMEEAAAIES